MRHFTVDIEFTCTPKLYFDTLSTFLLTNDRTDLDGCNKGVASIFDSERIYKKDLVKRNGHFYIDSIENSTYWMLLLECKLSGLGYSGHIRNVDFSKNEKDTLVVSACIDPNVQIISQE